MKWRNMRNGISNEKSKEYNALNQNVKSKIKLTFHLVCKICITVSKSSKNYVFVLPVMHNYLQFMTRNN